VEEARRYAARVLVLDEGALLFDGSPRELMARAGEPAGGDFERGFLSLLRDGDRP
jgi:energy-coupling factor transporter ATP-binding protein EcfA2